MSEANKETLHHTLIVLLFIAGLAVIVMLTVYIASKFDTSKPELACRDGKLFEVTHEGNITIYDPTFDDCEVKE